MFKGRMARLPFFGFRLLSAFLLATLGNIPNTGDGTVIFLIILLLMAWVDFYSSIKRLHDLDESGWLSLVMLIPLVNFIFGIYS